MADRRKSFLLSINIDPKAIVDQRTDANGRTSILVRVESNEKGVFDKPVFLRTTTGRELTDEGRFPTHSVKHLIVSGKGGISVK